MAESMAESPACDAGASTATHSSRHVDLVVKLGGAAITHKGSEVEHLNEPVLRSVAQTIAQTIQELRTEGRCPNVVVVHGAGSFGHQFAKQYGVASGGNGTLRVGTDDSSNRRLRLGIAKTRASVCRLNSLVVAALVDAGVNAVGVSPYGGWWTRDGGKTLDLARTKPAIDSLRRTVDAGLVAVVHGDVVLDSKSDCAILSGDTIVRQLCFDLKPKRAVFVTDVPGIFDKPPPKPNGGKRKRSAKNSETLSLLREVCLDASVSGNNDDPWHATRVAVGVTIADDGGVIFPETTGTVENGIVAGKTITSATVELAAGAAGVADVTGGIAGKMREAARVASLGVDVYVSNALRDGSAAAIRGRVDRDTLLVAQDTLDLVLDGNGEKPRPWFGTLVRGVKIHECDAIATEARGCDKHELTAEKARKRGVEGRLSACLRNVVST
ncbi:isopentenyl phosphate kinase [bacterium]|jgi:isopentenyl phosphate kinase|nr:isopentenyl phosphate kinase [bacterium]|tara:strand:+ start:1909 stop:3228 length:1320 start_codon:yes stop_codon:yes gene_type:complete